MSNEIQRHERYKQYAYYAYHLENAKFPKGTKILGMSEQERLIGQAKYKGKKFQDLSDSELQDAISFFI